MKLYLIFLNIRRIILKTLIIFNSVMCECGIVSGISILTSIQSSDHRKRVSGARASQEHSLSRRLIHIHQTSEIQTRYMSIFEKNAYLLN